MPSYAPLPNVLLDPRNEAELVQAAARRVYESSNATINDFSSGSPIMALLEGQAFAQAELLQFANQFPESVLVEWIGPFLGAQRRTGAASVVDITFTITGRDQQFDVFPGFLLSTNPALTGGESISFATVDRLVIPPGQTTGTVRAVSLFKSLGSNVPANTITRADTSLAGVESVINLQRASGGQDAELLSEVKERFFSLIRRRNPVSSEDWEDFFSDALGPGTAVTVLPRRSERGTYLYGSPHATFAESNGQPVLSRYGGDYLQSNPSISFFVLNPDGTPITPTQQSALQNLLKWSLPIEFLGHVYPMEVDDVDITLEVGYDPTKSYAQDLLALSKTVRNASYAVMAPNAVFPNGYEPQANDVESAMVTAFSLALGTSSQFIDPQITSLKAYSTPKSIGVAQFQGITTPLPFAGGYTVEANDLVVIQGNTTTSYYKALQPFNPEISTRSYYTNLGNISLRLIRSPFAGEYVKGDVVNIAGSLHVVLNEFTLTPDLATAEQLITLGYLSEAKTFTDWAAEEEISPLNDEGVYNPPIFAYEQGDSKTVTALPSASSAAEAEMEVDIRPGSPVYVAETDFTIAANTTTIGTAMSSGLIDALRTDVTLLKRNATYSAGDFIRTPAQNDLIPARPHRGNCYVDPVNGVVPFFARVVEGFTFTFEDDGNYKTSFDSLLANQQIELVQTILFEDCKGDPTFADRPFRYEARFFMGEYLRYRSEGGFDADQLEACAASSSDCDNVSTACTELLEANLPLPRYFFATRDFTPTSQNIDEILATGDMVEVDSSLFRSTYTIGLREDILVTPSSITNQLIEEGYVISFDELVIGETVLVNDEVGLSRGVYSWTGSFWSLLLPELPTNRDLFRFAPGDVVSFRNTSEIRGYSATEHVTPILDLSVYYDNGLFQRNDLSQTIAWFDPDYHIESVIYQDLDGAVTFYRTIHSFTPPATRTVWADREVDSSPRVEELFRNLLKFVTLSSCDDTITSRLRDKASSIKLGQLNLSLVSKSQGSQSSNYVFESSPTRQQAAALSYYPETDFTYTPVDYGSGTLGL